MSLSHLVLVTILVVACHSSGVIGAWSCNATLWKDTVEPLLQIYLAAVDGLPYLLKALDSENEHLNKTYPHLDGTPGTVEQVLGNEKNTHLCDFSLDGEPPNFQYVCAPAYSPISPDIGICKCSGIWQKNVVEHLDPVSKSLQCVAVPGSKCRRIPSFLRHFRGWLDCYPGAVCQDDPVERHRVLGNAEYEYAYGFCKCLEPGSMECKQLQDYYANVSSDGESQVTFRDLQLIIALLISVFIS